jgi:hypothetical protein
MKPGNGIDLRFIVCASYRGEAGAKVDEHGEGTEMTHTTLNDLHGFRPIRTIVILQVVCPNCNPGMRLSFSEPEGHLMMGIEARMIESGP